MKHFRRFIRRLFVVATSRTSRLNFVARITQACCIATTSGGKGQLGVNTSRAANAVATAEIPPIPAGTTQGSQFTLRAKSRHWRRAAVLPISADIVAEVF
jgi:hypothetical protein